MSNCVNKRILIDVGSSTIKAYRSSPQELKPLVHRSVPFKKEFDPERGISETDKKELFEFIDAIKEKNKGIQIKTYATAIFRELASSIRVSFIDEFFRRTGLFFNIIDPELENFYLEVALVGKCSLDESLLLINIGGGSTKLVVMYGKEAIERKSVDLGVGTINSLFPGIYKQISKVGLKRIVEVVKGVLPSLVNEVKVAFYTGGELTYMQLANYPLRKNVLFADRDHPYIISVKDFESKNKEVFEKVKLTDLESLMPENPTWMHGARGCSAIAQAICEKYGVETLIPSDSNIINGILRQELRYATISGSFRKHLDFILEIKKKLENLGTEILSPQFTEPRNPHEEFVVFDGEEGKTPLELERYHLDSITKSDALVVCNPKGYVGASALIEIGFANSLGKRIIFMEKPEEFMLNTLPAEVGL